MEYEVLGFDGDATGVWFLKEGKIINLKSSLPKNQLVAFLDIPPQDVTLVLRNSLLDLARKKGRLEKAYSPDGLNFYRDWFSEVIETRLFPIEEYKKLPYSLKRR